MAATSENGLEFDLGVRNLISLTWINEKEWDVMIVSIFTYEEPLLHLKALNFHMANTGYQNNVISRCKIE